ncbi:MAG TPA: APC family permease [Thermoleophilaceae bacterium]|nr:APC family permease [Thermoleophilaceae bacterium]
MATVAHRRSLRTRPRAPLEEDDRALRRHIGRTGLLFAAVGSIIGSGWLFGALNASQLAGPAAIIAWALGGFMILLVGLTYAELGAMFPVSGGVVRFPHYAFGSFASYVMGWITWLAAASVAPIEVEAALQYASNNIGGLAHASAASGGNPVLTFPLGYAVAVALMALFCFINFIGIRAFARANTAIVWWKLGVIVLVVIAFLVTTFRGANFGDFGGFRPYGWHGVFESISTAGIVFSFLGFRQGVELAGESDDPHRNVPLALIGSVLLATAIYIALQVAFIGAVPTSGLHKGWANLSFANDFGPLAGIAKIIGLAWLATVLYADAVISPAGTGLVYTTATARISYAMGRNGNAPRELTNTTDRGAPWVSLVLAFVVGLIFFLPFPGWQKLVSFITSATVLSFGSGPLVWAALRKELKDRERPFRLRGGHVIPFLAFFSSNMIVYWAGWDTNWKLFLAIGIGLVLLVVYKLSGRSQLQRMDWRAGAWVLPWLGALALISYLGSYGDSSDKLFGLGLGAAITFGMSVVIYLTAYALRLPRERVERMLAGTAGHE